MALGSRRAFAPLRKRNISSEVLYSSLFFSQKHPPAKHFNPAKHHNSTKSIPLPSTITRPKASPCAPHPRKKASKKDLPRKPASDPLFFLFSAVFSVELLNSAAGFKQELLAACVERMALGANLDSDFILCGACYEFIPAVAFYCHLLVIRMDTFSHFFHLILKIVDQ